MKTRPVYKADFERISKNTFASAKIEGIVFSHATKSKIKKAAAKKMKTTLR